MGTIIQTILVIAASIGFVLLGQRIVRRRVQNDVLTAHTDVAGFIYAAMSVVYAVILASVVIASWEDFRDARAAVEHESAALKNLARLANGWPEGDRRPVQDAVFAYMESVIADEWPVMVRGQAPSAETTARLVDLWNSYATVEPGPAGASARFAQSLEELDDVTEFRTTRLLASDGSLPLVMWIVLIAGALLTVGFAFLFAVESPLIQAMMLGSLAALIGLLLLLTQALDSPFQGATRVTPEAFEQALVLLNEEIP